MDSRRLESLFENSFGEPVKSVSPLKGDGSDRKLFRLEGAARSAIGAINSDRRENEAFLAFSRHFRQEGLKVPEIYAEDLEAGVYLEEDLGDTTLFQFLSRHRDGAEIEPQALELYRAAIRQLPRFQIAAGKTLDYGVCYPRRSFDKQSMLWDLNYFKYYFLRLAGVAFNEQELEEDFGRFSDFLLEADRDFFLYRDFQSRNIMVKGGEPHFIDYQGGRKGALQYDVASLLFDAKADLPWATRERLLEEYLDAASALASVDRARFMKHFPGYVVIRILQAMGAYGLRGFYERKSQFLQSIPYAIANLEAVLLRHELPVKLPALQQVFRALVASSRLRQFGGAKLNLTVRIESFSFHNGGMPVDEKGHGGGYVFDCRGLPNPGREPRFAARTGQDSDVVVFLERDPAVRQFLGYVYGLVEQTVENYRSRNFTDLLVSFGCTGGRHRSVYCAEALAKHLRETYGLRVELRHHALTQAP